MATTRRLAAILAADVAGYSRLMGADEEGTHAALKDLRREIADPKIAEHRGRIVKTTGDGLLVEFASVVDAVRCAVELQRAMAERNTAMPADLRIEFRIGINLGDVIIDEGDIYGDGGNLAARLEALAEPGGICVSRVVHDQVRDKLDLSFEDRGEQQVKNIARPVHVPARPTDTEPRFEPTSAKRVTSVPDRLFADRAALASLCRRRHIRRLSLFGSVQKGNARPDSDVDLLVEFAREAKPSFLDLAEIEQELSALLTGRRVDLRTAEDLSRYFRDAVLREAEVQYESA
jgi:class 3 adenylate cyclase/predicted nucleotidyltransferase